MNDPQKYELLNIFSCIVKEMRSAEVLDCAAKIILHALVNKRINKTFDLMQKSMAQTICFKFSSAIAQRQQIKRHVFLLTDYLLQNDLVDLLIKEDIEKSQRREASRAGFAGFDPERYKSEDKVLFDSGRGAKEGEANALQANAKAARAPTKFNFESEYSLTEKEAFLMKALKANVKILLQVNDCHQNFIKKQVGYALLDLEGNFVWADRKSCNLLDLKLTDEKKTKHGEEIDSEPERKGGEQAQASVIKAQKVNLFDNIIPPSKEYLKFKFGDEIFRNLVDVGSSLSFSYVFYSRISRQKYLKNLKNFSLFNYKEFCMTNLRERGNEYFYRYLKSVCSRATLVELSFSPKELEEIQDLETSQLQISKTKILQLKDELSLRRPKSEFAAHNFFIFLETRNSTKIPKFDYSSLEGDAKFKEFEDIVEKSLRRKENKVNSKKPSKRNPKKAPKSKRIQKAFRAKAPRRAKRPPKRRRPSSVREEVLAQGNLSPRSSIFPKTKPAN